MNAQQLEKLKRRAESISPDSSAAQRRYWWVNHKQTYRVELEGGYIWSPKVKKNGARNQAYDNLTLVQPGDVVISYADTLIKAIGVSTAPYSEAEKPGAYGGAGENWSDTGWKVPIQWTELNKQLRPKDHLEQISRLLPSKYSPLQRNGNGNQSVYLASISSELGRFILTLVGAGDASEISQLAAQHSTTITKTKGSERLPAEVLRQISDVDIWQAVQDLLAGEVAESFGPSTDYDLIAADGQRLPPKAVFGLAATRVLGFQVQPKHFTAGLGTPCFEALQAAGFLIVPKGTGAAAPEQLSYEDRLWSEGSPRLTSHLRRERAPGLSRAKKAQFRRDNHRLFCERCKMDPVETYGSELGEACIEVHHHTVQVGQMVEGHQTRLDQLQCLCASCHRVVHRELREFL